jgi:hypothetical protein
MSDTRKQAEAFFGTHLPVQPRPEEPTPSEWTDIGAAITDFLDGKGTMGVERMEIPDSDDVDPEVAQTIDEMLETNSQIPDKYKNTEGYWQALLDFERMIEHLGLETVVLNIENGHLSADLVSAYLDEQKKLSSQLHIAHGSTIQALRGALSVASSKNAESSKDQLAA